MSDLESTDLICVARRREMSERDQRRLEELLSRDLGARLMQLMQPDLERSSRVQPGDDVLAARIAEHALARPPIGLERKGWASCVLRRGRGPFWLLAAAIMFGATGAAAWWATHSGAIEAVRSVSEESAQGADVRRISKASKQRQSRESESKPEPALAPLPDQSGPDQSGPDQASAASSSASLPVVAPAEANPALRRDPVRLNSLPPTASQLFSEANLLRREGHPAQATRLYRNLLSEYPKTREASLSRLVLAKTLAGSNPRQSLAYYQEVARTDGSLRAEALWGIVETATQLRQTGIKEQALTDLMREFPESAYADVARRRAKDAGL